MWQFLLVLLLMVGVPPEKVKEKRFILKVLEQEVYVEISEKDPVNPGDVFEVYHPETTIRHPVTGELIQGELPVGFIIIEKIGNAFSIAVPAQGTPISEIKEGDFVYLFKGVKQTKKVEETKAFVWKDMQGWLDFCTYDKDDMYIRGELGFRYSVHKNIIYGLRFGLGGIYGFVPEKVREDFAKESANFYYGYSQFLIGSEYFSFLFKLKMGLDPDGVGYGFDGSIIIGSELRTYLLIGGLFERYTGAQAQILFQTPVSGKLSLYGHALVEWIPIKEMKPGFRMLVGTIINITRNSGLKLFIGAGGRRSDVIFPSAGAGYLWRF